MLIYIRWWKGPPSPHMDVDSGLIAFSSRTSSLHNPLREMTRDYGSSAAMKPRGDDDSVVC